MYSTIGIIGGLFRGEQGEDVNGCGVYTHSGAMPTLRARGVVEYGCGVMPTLGGDASTLRELVSTYKVIVGLFVLEMLKCTVLRGAS